MLIPTKNNVKSITDMRKNALELLEQVKKEGFAYIFYRSEPKAVMLDLEEFTRLQELLEDYLDEREAERLAKEPRGRGTPLEKIAEKYV